MLYRRLIFPDRVPPFPCLYTLFSDFRNIMAVRTDLPGHHCFSLLFKLFKIVRDDIDVIDMSKYFVAICDT